MSKKDDINNLLAGISAGITNAAISHPLEKWQTTSMVNDMSNKEVVKLLKNKEFLKAFKGVYRSYPARALKVGLTGGLMFAFYDRYKKLFDKINK